KDVDVDSGQSAFAQTLPLNIILTPPDCSRLVARAYDATMFIERAYLKRETLSDRDLGRLRASLIDQVQRYEEAIRGYSPDKMQTHGQPFLTGLRQKVADVEATIARRENGS
ncbi:hypothetical protein, partial [Sphingomonas sp. GC_Shp_2]